MFHHERVRIYFVLLELLSHSFKIALLLDLIEFSLLNVLLKSQIVNSLRFEVHAQLIQLGLQQTSQVILQRKGQSDFVIINKFSKLYT